MVFVVKVIRIVKIALSWAIQMSSTEETAMLGLPILTGDMIIFE
ncbi:hypothetical protein [Gloeocapsopsis dulcis]|nr:hypothetical protein [Gloeocapsopsis dulcis]WNN91773.1 hypothetical protein P0S91_12190 [Gloeocapsopsis dulcis]